MRCKYISVILILIVLILSAAVSASSSLKLTPTDNTVAVGEIAKWELKISNNAEIKQRYTIYSLQSGQGWNVEPHPLKDKIIEIWPGKSYITEINAQALEDFPPGIYNLIINIESDTGERYKENLKVYLSPEDPVNYLPSIKATIDMDEEIDPFGPVSIKLFLDNKNPLDLNNLKVRIQSDIPEFDKEVLIDLPPLERKTIEFNVVPSKYQEPKSHILFFVFEHEGQQVKLMEQRIHFIERLNDFVYTVYGESVFMKSYHRTEIRNEGNVRNTQMVKVPVSFWQLPLLSGTEGKLKWIDNKIHLTWEVTLSPNEKIDHRYIINYRVLFYILIALILFGLFYLYARSPVLVKKHAITARSDREGSISEIKVKLEIRNKTKNAIKDMKIVDTVPGIANVERSLELGTLKPTGIRHTKEGTKVTWSLAELDAHEHRLVTYKIRAKLNILGTFILPRSTVVYHKTNGKKRKAYSNSFRLN